MNDNQTKCEGLYKIISLTLFFFLLPLVGIAQYHSGKVGDYITLPEPTLSNGYEIYECDYHSNSNHLYVASGTSRVKILDYFSSYEIVQCDYYCVRQYTVSGRVYEDYQNGTAYYFISCSSNPNPDPNPDPNPNPTPGINPYNCDWEEGNQGTINIKVGETTTVDCPFNIPNYKNLKSITWTVYNSLGYNIISRNDDYCTIKGEYAKSNQKLWCLMEYGSTSYSAYFLINVTAIAPTGITVSPSSMPVFIGDSKYVKYSLTPSNASSSITWYSDDTSIAAVDKFGKVEGIGTGTTKIWAKTENGKTDYCSVTVKDSSVDPISISMPLSKTINIGEEMPIVYTLSPSNATTTLTWYSEASDIATVSAIGIVKGMKVGNTRIRLQTSNGITAYCNITVKKMENRGVEFSSEGYATFYDSQTAYKLPSGITAKVVTGASNNKLTYKTIAEGNSSGVLPKGTAVMLSNERKSSGTFTLTATDDNSSYTGTNMLRGSDNATTTTGAGFHYLLSYGQTGTNLNDVFGWYWGAQNGASFQIEGHKAWLVVPVSAATRGYTMDDESIQITDFESDIKEDNVYYDMQGRRIKYPSKRGLYIKDGKKVSIK